MNTVVILLGILLAIIGIAMAVYSSYRSNQDGEGIAGGLKAKVALIVIIGVLVFMFGCSFKIVPSGYTGVRTTFGQISEQPVMKGFNWKIPFVQSIKLVNNKQQDVTLKGDVWGETSEKTPVYASDTVITYQINGEKSAWIFANVSNPDELISANLVSSAIKSATAELNNKEVTVRDKIEPLVQQKLANSLTEKYGADTLTVVKVVINNMDFEDSYNEAIAAKSIAQQTYEKQQIENETAIAKAEADKKVAITNAEAEAQSTLISAQAEADANKLLAASLTDEVLTSKYYEKWNGELPTVMGENTVITDIGTTKPAE